MNIPILSATSSKPDHEAIIVVFNSDNKVPWLTEEENSSIQNTWKKVNKAFLLSQTDNKVIAGSSIVSKNNHEKDLEQARLRGHDVFNLISSRIDLPVYFTGSGNSEALNTAFLEGFLLSCYRFDKYRKEKLTFPEKYYYHNEFIGKESAEYINNMVRAVSLSRDLVNEPLNFLTAEQLSKELSEEGKSCGFDVQVYDKAAIKKMGFHALLEVNRGSQDPPTFTELTWKPENAVNTEPIVLVGKGIVYDTGGISLKSTFNSMDRMKSDMAGAAAVAGIFSLVARQSLPIYIKGLIPATDNRPSENAYVPGDIIRSHKGISIEVLNTDAEGRLILADALSYAEDFKPGLTIDIATLTGSASATFGRHAAACMHTASDSMFQMLEKAGNSTFEKIAPLPLWDEYEELIESKNADIRNSVGGMGCGAIGAGKFLQHFAPPEWIHLDIAGTGFQPDKFNYRGQFGTGFGVRLIYTFLNNFIDNK